MRYNFQSNFAKNVSFLRNSISLSRAAFAQMAGLSYSTIRNIEEEKTRSMLLTVTKIAKAAQLSVSDLLEK